MQLDASAITNTISPWRTLMQRSSWCPWLCSGTLLRHWGSSVWCAHKSLSPCVSTKVSRERAIGVLMQACFIPQQHETLRVQSCLCAANCYSDVPPLRLDIRPYSRDIWQDIPLHTTDSRSEEPSLLYHNHKWIRIMGGVLGAWLERFHPHISMEEDLKRKLSCVKHLILNNATQTLEIFHFSSWNVIWDHQVLTCFPVMTVIWRWVWFSPVF